MTDLPLAHCAGHLERAVKHVRAARDLDTAHSEYPAKVNEAYLAIDAAADSLETVRRQIRDRSLTTIHDPAWGDDGGDAA